MVIEIENVQKQRYRFIDVLKVIAAILITNSHYGNVWPYAFMAFGGLLGDVLYFAISGFCLADIKESFLRWYAKRVLRIYPVLWIVNIIGVCVGFFKISSVKSFVKLFVYPSYFHFISAIMLLYVIYFFVVKYILPKVGFKIIMLVLASIYVAIYLFVYDKSYYHIDIVEEGMVKFLFFASMLLGVYFRKYVNNGKSSILNYVQIISLLFLYLMSKIAFSKVNMISDFQILNVIILYILLWNIFKAARVNENTISNIRKMPDRMIRFLGAMTLEIYLTQYIIYYAWGNKTEFPINFFAITSGIILLSSVVYYLDKVLFDKIRLKLRKEERA